MRSRATPISVAVPHDDLGAWPWATFVTNLLGCLALGVLLDWVDARQPGWAGTHPRRARLARPLLASGVLGGFTTFSTFSVEAVEMVDAGSAAAASAYVVLSVLLGVACVLLGRALGAAAFGADAVRRAIGRGPVTPAVVLAVAAGAAVGAPVRFAVERWLGSAWPWGTWLVNVVGSAVLGVLVGVATAQPGTSAVVVALVGAGFCGALTTFGGFAAQVLDLAEAPAATAARARAWRSLGYALASVAACLAVAAAAYITTRSSLGR